MQWWEIVLMVAIALFAVVVIAVSYIRKTQGKSSCCSDCSHCSGCCSCNIQKKQNVTNKNS